jgi:hypothetical protein
VRPAHWLLLACTLICGLFAPGAVAVEPRPLVVTVATGEPALPTFAERIGSWFSDGTTVSLVLTPEVAGQLLLAISPTETRVTVVLRGRSRALVSFASTQGAKSRHLLRDLPLRDGLDELGLERLASVIHSGVLALRDGSEIVSRPEAEQKLIELGIIEAPAAAPLTTPQPVAIAAEAPKLDRPAPAPPAPNAASARSLWFVGLLYGGRARGAEGFGDGPGATFGLQPTTPVAPLDLMVRGQLLRSHGFDAGRLRASVTTLALRAELALEPALGRSTFLQAVVGGGADLARIEPSHSASPAIAAREPGSQWRAAAEVGLGLWARVPLWLDADVGLVARCVFFPVDVHYAMAQGQARERLVAPWPVQPSIALEARAWGSR